MKQLLCKTLLCLACSLALPTLALAERPMHPETQSPHPENRMKALADALKLSETQQAAWKDFMATMKESRLERPEPGEMANMSTPDVMEKRANMLRQRADMLSKQAVNVRKFYGQLSSEQKKVFDEFHRKQHLSKRPRGKMEATE